MNHQRKVRTGLVGVAVAVSLLATACGSGGGDDDAGDSSKPYKVLFVSGKTGLYANPAAAVGRGVQAKIDSINDKGGIKGRKVTLELKDNQSDPTRGVSLVQEALGEKQKPELVIPGQSSNEALSIAPLTSRQKIVTVGSASSPVLDDVKKYPYFFSASLTHLVIYESMLKFIKEKTPEVKRVALVTSNDALGDGTENFFRKNFEGTGIDISVDRFQFDSIDVTPVFQKALSAKPDWLIVEGAGAQVAIMLKSRLKAGGEGVPTIVGSSASSQPILDIVSPAERENVYNTLAPNEAFVEPANRGEEFNEFLKRIKDQGPLVLPISAYAAGWDSVGIWARGVENTSGEITGERVKATMEGLPKSDDPQFPAYGGGGGATKTSHFHPGDPDDFTFGQVVKVTDGMTIIK
ncbi:hypothetical protein BH09ACT10_BH09ACT10_29110 [soil metagenome]